MKERLLEEQVGSEPADRCISRPLASRTTDSSGRRNVAIRGWSPVAWARPHCPRLSPSVKSWNVLSARTASRLSSTPPYEALPREDSARDEKKETAKTSHWISAIWTSCYEHREIQKSPWDPLPEGSMWARNQTAKTPSTLPSEEKVEIGRSGRPRELQREGARGGPVLVEELLLARSTFRQGQRRS